MSDERREDLREVAVGVWRLSRVFERMRDRADDGQRGDWSATVLVFTLVAAGPMRSRALAERVHSDASTVSRQVNGLVEQGLVERRPDPADGRASVLAATEAGHELVRMKERHRDEHFGSVLGDWTDADLAAFAPRLARLADDLERQLQLLTGGCETPQPQTAPDRTRRSS